MNRESLVDALRRYAVAHPDEESTVARIVDLVRTHPDCFERTCVPGHLTASAWVTSPDRRRHLLVHHRKLGRWLQPGGHADGDPDLPSVALREVEEETGLTDVDLASASPIDVDVHRIPEFSRPSGGILEPAHEHHDVRFLCVASAKAPLVVSDESHAVRWFEDAEVRALCDDPSVLRLLDKSKNTL